MPTYQAGQFIGATLRSVQNQFDPNCEVIIADGGSVDDTLEICARFRPLVQMIIEGPDRGQLDGVLRALNAATGDIIYWLNADDIVMPGAFAEARRILHDNAIDFVFSDNFAFDEGKRTLGTGATIRGLTRADHTLFYRQLYSETVFFRRRCIRFVPESLLTTRLYTDYAFFLFTLHQARGQWTDKRLGAFRVVPSQASQRYRNLKIEEFRIVRATYDQETGRTASARRFATILHAPSFYLRQAAWPLADRCIRQAARWMDGNAGRKAQTDLFYDHWLKNEGERPDGAPQQEPGLRHELEAGLHR